MTLRERIAIDVPPEMLWPYLSDPVLLGTWNPRIREIERDATGPVVLGERFGLTFQMSRAEHAEMEVLECTFPTRIVFRHHRETDPNAYADLTFDVRATDGGCVLTQTFDLSRAGIPVFFRVLIWLISRFGKPEGATYLQELKQDLESKTQAEYPS